MNFGSTICAFIPFIRLSMNYDDVVQLFDRLMIGNIVHLDIHCKINERNQAYQFAFVHFEPYNTIQGVYVAENLFNNISTRVAYDPNSPSMYLEIKPYLQFEERITVQSLCRELLEVLPDRYIQPRNHSAFDTINEEYDEIQKEINELMAAPVYSIWTTPLLFVQ
jgi:hypothetical protein